jgi:hypothetical protein
MQTVENIVLPAPHRTDGAWGDEATHRRAIHLGRDCEPFLQRREQTDDPAGSENWRRRRFFPAPGRPTDRDWAALPESAESAGCRQRSSAKNL